MNDTDIVNITATQILEARLKLDRQPVSEIERIVSVVVPGHGHFFVTDGKVICLDGAPATDEQIAMVLKQLAHEVLTNV